MDGFNSRWNAKMRQKVEIASTLNDIHMIHLHNFLFKSSTNCAWRESDHLSFESIEPAQYINYIFIMVLFSLNRNISSENSSFIIIPSASTSSQQCRINATDHWQFTGRKTNCRRIRTKSVRFRRTMYGACIATGSCWRTTGLEWNFEVNIWNNLWLIG